MFEYLYVIGQVVGIFVVNFFGSEGLYEIVCVDIVQICIQGFVVQFGEVVDCWMVVVLQQDVLFFEEGGRLMVVFGFVILFGVGVVDYVNMFVGYEVVDFLVWCFYEMQ